ncbi:MAG TPA: PspC domain-containing protein [Streptosporangiaceae bacterium]|nr:PspC domain-containing protein [Streptosporangiaceae bacterium]
MNTTTMNPEANDETHSTPQAQGAPQFQPQQGRPHQPLSRPIHDRMLAGVAAGIARYLGVDVTVVRIVFAVLTVVGGAAVPIYLAGWLLIPEEGSEQSIASGFIQSRQH